MTLLIIGIFIGFVIAIVTGSDDLSGVPLSGARHYADH